MLTLTAAAKSNVAETGIDPALDVEAIRSGTHTAKGLLADCLAGADEDRVAGWREYVAAIAAAATPDSAIDQLRREAGRAGDTTQADLCTAALDGDELARAECMRVIRDAAAMAD